MSAERVMRIEADGVRLYAILATTPTADAAWDALPLTGEARLQRDEIDLAVPLRLPLEKTARAGATGEIVYRPEGPLIAFRFGPAAEEAAVAAPSPPGNVLGRITGDSGRLARVRDGGKVRLTRIEG